MIIQNMLATTFWLFRSLGGGAKSSTRAFWGLVRCSTPQIFLLLERICLALINVLDVDEKQSSQQMSQPESHPHC